MRRTKRLTRRTPDWTKRRWISPEHRLVYLVDGDDMVILKARYHYSLSSDNSTASADPLCHIRAISSGKQGSALVFSGEPLPAC